MIQKITPRGPAPKSLARTFCFSCFLSEFSVFASQNNLKIPKEIFLAIKNFSERNSLVSFSLCKNCDKEISHGCPACLKAHIIKLAAEFNLPERETLFLSNLFDSDIGHKGYYLDKNRIVRL